MYDGRATISIAAHDALSGVEDIVYVVDGQADYATPTPDPDSLNSSADVDVDTLGVHTLSWFAVDNAGNHESAHALSFRINQTGYVPVLGKPSISVKRVRKVTFSGSVTPATTAKTVTLTLQRLSGRSFKPFTKYSVTVPRYANTYSVRKYVSRAGAYRVRAAEGAGTGAWSKNFKL